ncbi:DUF2946 domain-containing protein [Bradyrhizobium sp. INPA01-394B]|uniref:DUF2946 domain-containing protein n=1 Tax=Bradyrhizobium campsiandrae TaxID=1729892 RepID=A0ABR7UD19_9BRAD|nr:DUF2946 domain-containing protein [Bradyrhizobium campsiandrae]MBC9881206.1 DUF2946 domain-containing protein [Bradyrhizobium campsiandrae]MBC9981813.1 DUF2946 domain-containing protein [Bradyrhizobium campsiandrae]
MKWFRSNIRHGARLALFAMLVQLALTFGHSHWFAQAAPLAQSQLSDSAKGTAKSIPSTDRAAVQKQSPTSPDREQPGDDVCAICALVAMAGTVVFATPPLLLLPQVVELLQRTTDVEFLHLESAGTAFQPRAPPVS